MKPVMLLWAIVAAVGCMAGTLLGDDPQPCTITLDAAENGAITIQPTLPENKTVPMGTELTLSATPAAGYALDTLYYIGTGNQGRMYYENALPQWKITIN